MAGVAAELAMDTRGACRWCRIALLSVGDTPVLAEAAMQAVTGNRPDAKTIETAGRAAASALDPPADLHASSAYRRHLADVLVARALRLAATRSAARLGGAPAA
jgi:CO/xanthine dehydrogenase FAD-binding subunit